MRYFYVLNIKDRNLSALIDGIRVIANPYIKHPAHITVRGPYNKKYKFSRVNDDIIGSEIKINGTGDFFNFNQNTVYLKCESESLRKATYKRDYQDSFNPHITLYDGNDRGFSEKLYSILNRYNFNFNIFSSNIEPLLSRGKGGVKNDKRFILRDEFYSNLSYYLKKKINYEDVLSLSKQDRLILIEKLCSFLNKNPNPNVCYSPIQNTIDKLGLNEDNGLFYFSNIRSWERKFPFRIIRALKEIKPYAIHCLFKNDVYSNHYTKPFNQPFILFFDNPINDVKIHNQVFSFGQAPLVFIDKINSLEILNGYEFLKKSRRLRTIGDESLIDHFTIENLIYGRDLKDFYSSHFNNVKRVDNYLLENISEVRSILLNQLELPPGIANSLIGRLIFTRYLIDRGVVFKEGDYHFFGDLKKQDRNKFFVNTIKNKEKIYNFFSFLKDKLNGDLFPVTDQELKEVKQEHLNLLHFLFKGGKIYFQGASYSVQESLFDVYDFKVIPIELISNIYENFIGNSKRVQNKAFYTPSFLVDFVLSENVTNHINNNSKASCKILDPSCGSGIFLIETLRKLIEKYKYTNSNKISDFKLWKLVQDNIFGIDIDSNAIDVAIFSLYVTILDYKQPKEISRSFKFRELKNVNFFPDADFFDTNHLFNDVLKTKKLDFIIGNPPWGHVKKSLYVDYINSVKNNFSNGLINIGSKEISQAFIIRALDFLNVKNNTKCTFIISSKAFYNTSKTTKDWRSFVLNNLKVNQIVELSPVNNKIAGGHHIFDGARQPTAIITFELPKAKKELEGNVIKHVSIKPHLNHKYFKSFVITNYDYKDISQKLFNPTFKGHDWLWKVMLHGNLLDFEFIKRLKSDFKSLSDYEEIEKPKEGIKYKDGEKSYSTKQFYSWKFLETNQLNSFSVNPRVLWKEKAKKLHEQGRIDSEYNIGYLPNDNVFKGNKVLIREALTKNFNALCAYDEDNYLFNQSISAIKLKKEYEDDLNLLIILKSIVGLFNSRLFTYYIFHTSSSAGVDRARAIINEFLSFPIKEHSGIAKLTMEIQTLYTNLNSQNDLVFNESFDEEALKKREELDKLIYDAYNISNIEENLIDYTINVSIPLLKRNDEVFRALNFNNSSDKEYLEKYIGRFTTKIKETFGKKPSVKVVQSPNYLGVFLKLDSNIEFEYESANDLKNIVDYIGEKGVNQISKGLYYQKAVSGWEKNMLYIIKPNEYKSWHSSLALYELDNISIKSPVIY